MGDREEAKMVNEILVRDYMIPLLAHATLLVDLRLNLPPMLCERREPCKFDSTVFGDSGTFQLSTLFCWNALDFVAILRAHCLLKTLGIYFARGIIPGQVRSLMGLSSSLLLLAMWLPEATREHGRKIEVYPDLLDAGDDPRELQIRLATVLNAEGGLERKPGGVTWTSGISWLTIIMEDFENAAKLKVLFGAVRALCPLVSSLGFGVMRSTNGLFTQEVSDAFQIMDEVVTDIYICKRTEGHFRPSGIDVEQAIVVEYAREVERVNKNP
ncbi:hypothetical protein BKA70DRAFT_1408436 [Coprinopsis sp. MPI-PUGE-AT-0042]|nr:hypothetical protein BKA70DRAFT_1408436 [Coprinopsis sp. MPI-PUGE-AT-0042]